MARRRPAFLKRSIANEDRRRSQARAESRTAAATFGWAAVGVTIVVATAVLVGFTDRGAALARFLGGLDWLTQPAMMGVSTIDILIVLGLGAAVALYLWRDWRRGQR